MPDADQLYRIWESAVKVCTVHGIRYVVMSPGSRSAPIALAFLRNKKITPFIITDERSAGYTAIGLSRASGSPVALVCTSGTAGLNLAPAVAEAYFQQVPLVVFSADRPPEFIGNNENQTIFQSGMYGKHAAFSCDLPIPPFLGERTENVFFSFLNKGLNRVKFERKPVHFNCPLREPLYPGTDVFPPLEMAGKVEIDEDSPYESESWLSRIIVKTGDFKKIMIVGGLGDFTNEIEKLLGKFCETTDAVFFPDLLSNLGKVETRIQNYDLILASFRNDFPEELRPDLLITFGGPFISKNLRTLLRMSPPAEHWHIGLSGDFPDPFRVLKEKIRISPLEFFSMAARNAPSRDEGKFLKYWQALDTRIDGIKMEVLDDVEFSELHVMRKLMKTIPSNSVVHLGNSLPVRVADWVNPGSGSNEFYSNRGASGIDGSLSTATGFSFISQKDVYVILGDLSFLYDRNALWNNYLGKNLKIIVFNNHGGGIFDAIPGPSSQPEFREYFLTRQPLSFEFTARQHGLKYFISGDEYSFEETWKEVAETQGPLVFEIEFSGKGRTVKEVRDEILSRFNL